MKKHIFNTVLISILCVSLSSCKYGETAAVRSTASTLAQMSAQLTEGKWHLVELRGKPVETNAYIEFSATDNKVSAFLGCNTLTGTYTLNTGNRLKVSQAVATQRACLNATVEDEFKTVINMFDNYNITDNKLVLNRLRMAPLARFERVIE